MAKPLALYRTYIIRCWQEPCSQTTAGAYRFSLEIPVTGERFGFTSSKELITALEAALTQIQTHVRTNGIPEDEPD